MKTIILLAITFSFSAYADKCEFFAKIDSKSYAAKKLKLDPKTITTRILGIETLDSDYDSSGAYIVPTMVYVDVFKKSDTAMKKPLAILLLNMSDISESSVQGENGCWTDSISLVPRAEWKEIYTSYGN